VGDLPNFERGQIIGVHLAGTSVTKTAILLGVSRVTVSKVMLADTTHHGKTVISKEELWVKVNIDKEIIVHGGLFQKITELLQHR
jgi:hypothetical protein